MWSVQIRATKHNRKVQTKSPVQATKHRTEHISPFKRWDPSVPKQNKHLDWARGGGERVGFHSGCKVGLTGEWPQADVPDLAWIGGLTLAYSQGTGQVGWETQVDSMGLKTTFWTCLGGRQETAPGDCSFYQGCIGWWLLMTWGPFCPIMNYSIPINCTG